MSATTQAWTIGGLLDWTARYLHEKGSEFPRLDAEVLLAHALGCKRIQLYTRYEEPAPEDCAGVPVVMERGAVELRVAVEVARLADLRPRRPDPEGHEREEQVHDPDPEVLAALPGEPDRQALRRGCGGDGDRG